MSTEDTIYTKELVIKNRADIPVGRIYGIGSELIIEGFDDVDVIVKSTTAKVRTEAKKLESHGSEYNKIDGNGVGFTFTGTQVHAWTPWSGTGNDPAPPEHPVYGGGDRFDQP